MPAQYMFRDIPERNIDRTVDPVAVTLGEMDRYGIEIGLVSASVNREITVRALTEHPERFVASWTCDPNDGMDGIRALVQARNELGIRAASFFPHGTNPQVALDAPMMYAYSREMYRARDPRVRYGRDRRTTCSVHGPACRTNRPGDVRLSRSDLRNEAWSRTMGRPGGQAHAEVAEPLLLDECVRPPLLPEGDRRLREQRGAEKVMYAGYFPMGLSLDRIFGELPKVPFKEDVWPNFLRHNAVKVLKLGNAL